MWKTIASLLLFTILLLTISISSMRQKSATSDEVAHIPAGYTYVKLGDFRMNPEHPPLIKALAAIPLLFLPVKMDVNDPLWSVADPSDYRWIRNEWEFGPKFLYAWNDADRLVFWSRIPVVLLSLLLGVGVWLCARDLYGEKAGYVALALFLFNPDLIAHGQLVTTDLGVSLFMFMAVYAFYRALRALTAPNALLVCLAVGLALLTKFSGALIFPMLALVGAVFALSGNPVKLSLPGEKLRRELSSRREKLMAAAALIAASAIVGFVMIWAAYGFRYSVSPDPAISQTLNWGVYYTRPGVAVELARAAQKLRLAPEAYLLGFLHALKTSDSRPAFLMGEYSETGWRHFFIITFLVKTPIPFILLLIIGAVFTRRYGAGLAAEGMLLLPVGFYWLFAIMGNLNIGNRHLLPVYPLLIVFTSKVGRVFDSWRPRRLALALSLLVAWNAVETALIYPHFLTYFNQIAGGPRNGHRWLVDSNLDWGQDLKGLAKYLNEHPGETVYLSYFGAARAEYYGIKAQMLPGFPAVKEYKYAFFNQVPPGALIAVSATMLQCVVVRDEHAEGIQKFMARLRSQQPVETIGNSIFIYRY
jgi:hypothetical protein